MNSDLSPGIEENAAAAVQFARFATASAGRSRRSTGRARSTASPPSPAGRIALPILGLAYGDVVAAWRDYLQHRNNGRPFVLIGHSQGTIHLTQLLAREIEGRPEAARMISALLLGFNVEVPQGRDVGGSFQRTPLCTRAGQTGCVVTYVSFRDGSPPPEGALFGRAARAGQHRRLHQSGRARRHVRGAARFLLVRQFDLAAARLHLVERRPAAGHVPAHAGAWSRRAASTRAMSAISR